MSTFQNSKNTLKNIPLINFALNMMLVLTTFHDYLLSILLNTLKKKTKQIKIISAFDVYLTQKINFEKNKKWKNHVFLNTCFDFQNHIIKYII